jgi:hypothetical protein
MRNQEKVLVNSKRTGKCMACPSSPLVYVPLISSFLVSERFTPIFAVS